VRPLARDGAQRWERLAELVQAVDADGLRELSADELDELARLYRRAASDLARARARRYDPSVVRYLNDLVGRAAGLVYGGRLRRRFRAGVFFLATVPRTFRAALPYMAISFLLFMGAAVVAASLAAREPAWADELFSPQIRMVVEEFLSDDAPSGQYFADAQASLGADQLSAAIALNNVKVALIAFSLGITFCLGTIWALISNGLMLGAFLGVGAWHDRLEDILAIVAPHGVLELSAIFICGGAGLMIGWAIIAPGDRLRADALATAARKAVTLVIGCVPMFLIAGAIEGVLSPQTSGLMQANEPRILFGVMTGLILLLYLFAGDRLIKAPEDEAPTLR